jgi:hypothetical protein
LTEKSAEKRDLGWTPLHWEKFKIGGGFLQQVLEYEYAAFETTIRGGRRMSLALSLDFQYTASTQKLWSALTDSSKLAKWVANIQTGEAMENDF